MKRHHLIGMSDEYDQLDNAVVYPHAGDGSFGVLDQDGEFCLKSTGMMGPRRLASAPVAMPDDAIGHLPGRHLFAGWLRPHFGHFLVESTCRLWALDTLLDDVDSIIFSPFRRGGLRPALKSYSAFLETICKGKPLTIVKRPTRVDRLYVPDMGFGHGKRIEGSDRFRHYFRDTLRGATKPVGSERLYISRSALMDKRGGIFGEIEIEALMAANGYDIFHPQKHSVHEQLERYRAASEIVCVDGSALHLAAFVIEPGARIGIIQRRRAGLLDGLKAQLDRFASADVHMFDALRNMWVDQDAKRVDFRAKGELDLPQLAQMLARTGFVSESPSIRDVSTDEIRAQAASLSRGPMRPIKVEGASDHA